MRDAQGRLAARFVRAMVIARGSVPSARAFVAGQRWSNCDAVDSVLKGSIPGLGIGEAIATRRDFGVDLLPAVRERAVIDRLGARRVPMSTRMLNQSGRATGQFVRPGDSIPVTKVALTESTAAEKKCGAIAVVSNELVRSSDPDAERAIADLLTDALVVASDSALLDAQAADSARPASITYNAPSVVATGATLAAILTDAGRVIDLAIASGADLSTCVWVMSSLSASFLSRVPSSTGAPAFPDITARGGSWLGFPVITTAALDNGGSPTSRSLCLVDSGGIAVSDPTQVELTISIEGTAEMLTDPIADALVPTPAQLVSFFQTSCAGIRVLRYLTWESRRAGAVTVLSATPY